MDRICNEALLRKVTTPRAAAAHIKNGMTVGFSGFTVIGYPKVLPAELARRAEEGEELGITVITGGNVGDQLDGVLARSGVMKRRYGFQGNRDLRALANADRIQYVDTHVSHGPYLIKNGYLGKTGAGGLNKPSFEARRGTARLRRAFFPQNRRGRHRGGRHPGRRQSGAPLLGGH